MSNATDNLPTRKSIVDRTIYPTFTNIPTSTPSTASSKSCISPNIELLHRLNGTSILSQTTTLLRLSASTFATSTTIFHRFYHRKSLREYDVWSVSLGCVVLACKIEEEIRRASEIILVFVHVYRRMRFAIDYHSDDVVAANTSDGDKIRNGCSNLDETMKDFQTACCSLLEERELNQEERQNILRYIKPLPRRGPLYKEWEEELMRLENVILRELGFTLYWIPESHPHVFLLYFMKVLELVDDNQNDDKNDNMNENSGKGIIGQMAWNYCNDSCRLDLCLRYEAELIACAAIHLACVQEKNILPMEPRPWWHVFIGPGCDKDLSNVCNALLALCDENCMIGYKDAMKKYVVSLIEEGSFNDPGSFIWNDID